MSPSFATCFPVGSCLQLMASLLLGDLGVLRCRLTVCLTCLCEPGSLSTFTLEIWISISLQECHFPAGGRVACFPSLCVECTPHASLITTLPVSPSLSHHLLQKLSAFKCFISCLFYIYSATYLNKTFFLCVFSPLYGNHPFCGPRLILRSRTPKQTPFGQQLLFIYSYT